MEHAYLEGKEVIPVDVYTGDRIDREKFAYWGSKFSDSEGRRVAQDVLKIWGTPVHISTVFLGMNHRYGDGAPLWFESMIFGGKFDEEQVRYTTWAEAEAGHKKLVDKVLSYQRAQVVMALLMLFFLAAAIQLIFNSGF